MSNERTETWLRGLGFDPEPEPTWITTGRRPDFFARGPADTWVEVKELGRPEHDDAFSGAWNDLIKRCEKSGLTGHLYAVIDVNDQQAAKAAFKHVERIHHEVKDDGTNYVVMIPGDPAYCTNVRVEYESRDGNRTVQVGPASISNLYQCFPSLEPKNWSAEATLHNTNGTVVTAKLHKIVLSREPPPIVLRLFHSTEPLSLSAGHSAVRDNTSHARIRRVVADCNSQIRNGQRYAPAPGLAVVYQENPDALGDEQFLAALFGDLAVEVIRDPPRLGRAFLSANGVLTRANNRGIGAVLYVRHATDTVLAVNPHAEVQLPWQHFAERAWVQDGDRYILRQR